MITYLYRAVATEHVDNAYNGEPIAWPGMPLGRASGYLSRSSAVIAGQSSGVAFVIVRSEPVVFHDPPEVDVAELRAENRELRDRIRTLTG